MVCERAAVFSQICNMFFPGQFQKRNVVSIWNNHFEKDLDFSNECCNISRNIIISDEKCLSKGMLQQFKGYCALWWIFLCTMSSRRCYVRLWDILHTPFVFSNLENVLFLSMFYVVMHRCIEMHVDVYDIDAFRCTTIYIYTYIYIQMIVDVYRSQI